MNTLINYLGSINELSLMLRRKTNYSNQNFDIEEKLDESIDNERSNSILKSIASKLTCEKIPENRIILNEGISILLTLNSLTIISR